MIHKQPEQDNDSKTKSTPQLNIHESFVGEEKFNDHHEDDDQAQLTEAKTELNIEREGKEKTTQEKGPSPTPPQEEQDKTSQAKAKAKEGQRSPYLPPGKVDQLIGERGELPQEEDGPVRPSKYKEDHPPKQTKAPPSSSLNEAKKKPLQSSASTNKKNDSYNNADARADRIETHYKSGGISHQEQGYDELYKKRTKDLVPDKEKPKLHHASNSPDPTVSRTEEALDYLSKKEQTGYEHEGSEQKKPLPPSYELGEGHGDSSGYDGEGSQRTNDSFEHQYGNEELGEQTIDYKKLKDEFNGLSDQALETITSDEYIYQEELEELKTIENSLEQAEQSIVPPLPQGLDKVIEIYGVIESDGKLRDCLKIIEQALWERYRATCLFFIKRDHNLCELTQLELIHLESNKQKLRSAVNPLLNSWAQMPRSTFCPSLGEEWSKTLIFPYLKGVQQLGLAVVSTIPENEEDIGTQEMASIEIMIESLKGQFLAEAEPLAGQTKQDKTSGLGSLGRLFSKKAG